MKNFKDHICPNCFQIIDRCKKKSRCYFKILDNNIPSFTNHKTSKITDYEIEQAHKFYKNFLSWLFKTFKTNEKEFRKKYQLIFLIIFFCNLKNIYNLKIAYKNFLY